MQNNDISKLNDIHDLDELHAIREAHRKEEAKVAEAIRQAEERIILQERNKRHQEEGKFRDNLAATICSNHEDLSYGSCVQIVDRAWEYHHSYGTQEVINAANDLADFVEQIFKVEYQNKILALIYQNQLKQ